MMSEQGARICIAPHQLIPLLSTANWMDVAQLLAPVLCLVACHTGTVSFTPKHSGKPAVRMCSHNSVTVV